MNTSLVSEFPAPNPLSGAWGDLHSTGSIYSGPGPCPEKGGKHIFLALCGKCYYGSVHEGCGEAGGEEGQGG